MENEWRKILNVYASYRHKGPLKSMITWFLLLFGTSVQTRQHSSQNQKTQNRKTNFLSKRKLSGSKWQQQRWNRGALFTVSCHVRTQITLSWKEAGLLHRCEFSHELQTMLAESGLDIVYSSHTCTTFVSDTFSLTGNILFSLGERWCLGRACRRWRRTHIWMYLQCQWQSNKQTSKKE